MFAERLRGLVGIVLDGRRVEFQQPAAEARLPDARHEPRARVALLVEAATDNPTRTAGNVRSIFHKWNGNGRGLDAGVIVKEALPPSHTNGAVKSYVLAQIVLPREQVLTVEHGQGADLVVDHDPSGLAGVRAMRLQRRPVPLLGMPLDHGSSVGSARPSARSSSSPARWR